MPFPFWVSNYELARQINALHVRYNGAAGALQFRLFQNDVTPGPSTVLADLVEADYQDYEPHSLLGDWSAPAQDLPGRWVMQTSLHVWDPPAGGAAQTIYGGYLTDQVNLVLSARLSVPHLMFALGDPLRLRAIYRDRASAAIE